MERPCTGDLANDLGLVQSLNQVCPGTGHVIEKAFQKILSLSPSSLLGKDSVEQLQTLPVPEFLTHRIFEYNKIVVSRTVAILAGLEFGVCSIMLLIYL